MPHNGSVQGFAAAFVPDDCGLSLVSDADSFDIRLVATILGIPQSTFHTLLNTFQNLFGIMLSPPAVRKLTWIQSKSTCNLLVMICRAIVSETGL